MARGDERMPNRNIIMLLGDDVLYSSIVSPSSFGSSKSMRVMAGHGGGL